MTDHYDLEQLSPGELQDMIAADPDAVARLRDYCEELGEQLPREGISSGVMARAAGCAEEKWRRYKQRGQAPLSAMRAVIAAAYCEEWAMVAGGGDDD